MAVEYRPEDTNEEVIGGTLISEDSRTHLRSNCMLANWDFKLQIIN